MHENHVLTSKLSRLIVTKRKCLKSRKPTEALFGSVFCFILFLYFKWWATRERLREERSIAGDVDKKIRFCFMRCLGFHICPLEIASGMKTKQESFGIRANNLMRVSSQWRRHSRLRWWKICFMLRGIKVEKIFWCKMKKLLVNLIFSLFFFFFSSLFLKKNLLVKSKTQRVTRFRRVKKHVLAPHLTFVAHEKRR